MLSAGQIEHLRQLRDSGLLTDAEIYNNFGVRIPNTLNQASFSNIPSAPNPGTVYIPSLNDTVEHKPSGFKGKVINVDRGWKRVYVKDANNMVNMFDWDEITPVNTVPRTKFKLGDRVKHKPWGDTGEVVDLSGPLGYIGIKYDSDSSTGYQPNEDLELIDTRKYKVGDRVTANVDGSTFEGIIYQLKDNKTYTIRLDNGQSVVVYESEIVSLNYSLKIETKCKHEPVKYTGLLETFNYCQKCGAKESDF